MITPSASRSSKYLQSYETPGYASGAAPGSGATGQAESQIGKSPYWSPQAPGSSRGGGSSGSSSKRSSTKTVRKGEAPEMPDLPTFKAPEMDKRAVKALTQKMAAPGIRTLRESVQQAMGKNYENPNVRKMTLREALQGYGTGLEKVMSGASREARSEKMAELDLKRQAEAANFQAQTAAKMQQYNNAWQDYLKGSETVTTTGEATGGSDTGVGGGVQMGGNTYFKRRDPFTGNVVPI